MYGDTGAGDTGMGFEVVLRPGWLDPHGAATILRPTYSQVIDRLRDCHRVEA